MERTPEGKVKVYDLETGTVREHWPVDGRDIVIAGAGRFAFSLPVENVPSAAPVYSGTPEEIQTQFYNEARTAGYDHATSVNIMRERWTQYLAEQDEVNTLKLPPSPHLGATVLTPLNSTLAKAEVTLEEAKAVGELAPGVPLVVGNTGAATPTALKPVAPGSISPSL